MPGAGEAMGTFAEAAKAAPKTVPIRRKNVGTFRMSDFIEKDETPTTEQIYQTFFDAWTKEHSTPPPRVNIVWLHHSRAFRMEFKDEVDYIHACILMYEFNGQSISMEPDFLSYLSIRLQGVCPIWLVDTQSLKAALDPIGVVQPKSIHHGLATINVKRRDGSSFKHQVLDGHIYVIVKPRGLQYKAKVPTHVALKLTDGQTLNVKISAIRTGLPHYRKPPLCPMTTPTTHVAPATDNVAAAQKTADADATERKTTKSSEIAPRAHDVPPTTSPAPAHTLPTPAQSMPTSQRALKLPKTASAETTKTSEILSPRAHDATTPAQPLPPPIPKTPEYGWKNNPPASPSTDGECSDNAGCSDDSEALVVDTSRAPSPKPPDPSPALTRGRAGEKKKDNFEF